MVAMTPETFERFWAYYNREQHQRGAIARFYRLLQTKAPDLLDENVEWVQTFRNKPRADVILNSKWLSAGQIAYVAQWEQSKFDAEFVSDFNWLVEMCRLTSVNALRLLLAHTCHETARYVYMQEIGGPDYCARMYDNRKDLGNGPGDGYKFRGCGVIQLTGRFNHQRFSEWLDRKRLSDPRVMAEGTDYTANRYPFLCAADWIERTNWKATLDTGDLEASTRQLNGGLNGLEDRRRYWLRACEVID